MMKNQDPFAVLELGKQKYETQVINGGGKKPVWNEKVIFEVDGTSQALTVSVLDKDPYSSDYNSGSTILLQDLCKPNAVDAWFNLEYQNKVVGKIRLSAKWIPPTQ